MAGDTPKSGSKMKKPETAEVTFKCRRCEAEKPISEMTIVKRFRPVIVVCRNCDKELR
jgi:transcription elongation factor Elf1